VVYLDCQNVESAVQSLAEASQTADDLVVEAMQSFETNWDLAAEDPFVAVPRDFFRSLDVAIDDLRFEGAYFFHASRVIDPDSFRREGIQPLEPMVDRLWDTLYELARDLFTEEGWRRFRANLEAGGGGEAGSDYREKVGNRLHHGPHGMLVRDTVLIPEATGSHDYLAIPEIVEDIAVASGFDLRERFEAAATSCIVKFRASRTSPVDVRAAFWYVYKGIRGEGIGESSLSGIALCGSPVPAADILAVDRVTPQQKQAALDAWRAATYGV